MKLFAVFCCVLYYTITNSEVNSEKILSVSFFSSQSHKNVYEPMLQALANKGHTITVISPYPGYKNPNIKEIIPMTEEEMQTKFPLLTNWDPFEGKIKKTFANPFTFLTETFDKICRYNYNLTQIKELKNEKFDLIFISAFMNECVYGLVHELNAPFILISPFVGMPFTLALTGSPSSPSFTPLAFFGYTDKMDFMERTKNFVTSIGFTILYDYIYAPQMAQVYQDVFGPKTPGVNDILRETSLILVNSHFSINFNRPLMPDVIEVGGMHCREAKPLANDLETFLKDTDKDGFIYFSMGSVVKGNKMPEKYRLMFMNAFSKLKQKVLWKFENETMSDLPKNVKISKWLPQQDLLGHKNIKLFITHGGLLSTEEAIYHGVPLIGIPIFGDQDGNMLHAQNRGFAISLELTELTEDLILNSIQKIVSDSKYKENVAKLSKLFRDRPEKPLDTAVYWAEYVMRHKGAKHLRSPARDLNTLQYHSVDVIAFLFAVLLTGLYVIFKIGRFIIRKICCIKDSKTKKNKKD